MTAFPTYLNMSISPKSLKNWADSNLTVKWSNFDDGWIKTLKKRSLLVYTIYFGLAFILKVLSFGLVSIKKTDFIIVYGKI